MPAVTHVDYSARIQTVHQDTNLRYYALLSAFERKTGRPAPVKRFLANVALAICALAVSFSFGKIVIRLLYKNETMLFPRYHTGYQ